MPDEKRKAVLDRSYIEELIFGRRDAPESDGEPRRYRFTQDSPVLPDVWIRYGEQPTEARDLLLTPHFGITAGEVSRDLRARCVRNRESSRRGEAVDIAFNKTYVVAELYFEELVRVVLPMTGWWQQNLSAAVKAMGGIGDAGRALDEDSDLSVSLAVLADEKLQKTFVRYLDLFESRSEASSDDGAEVRKLADLLWMTRIVGSIAWAQANPKKARGGRPSHLQMIQAIADLVGDLEFDDEREKALWQVNLNRPAGTAVDRSTLAVKADAARLLFEVKCGEVAWAVVDSGIDASHPAFWDWNGDLGDTTRALKAAATSKEQRRSWNRSTVRQRLTELRQKDELDQKEDLALWPGLTRVKATYDFTRARALFNCGNLLAANGELVAESKWPDFVRSNIRRARRRDESRGKDPEEGLAAALEEQLKELAQRLYAGRDIDWGLAKPFLEVPHDDAEDDTGDGEGEAAADRRFYQRPRSEHGTHVAGILAGDWPQQQMKGMCPDLKLYDMRVIGPDSANSDEFAVLSALQFITYLNDQKDLFAVHGVNMSLSIRHDVANFACGRTPACDECERLVSSGVVVVAAAGNHGYLRYQTSEGFTEGYHTVSITDPGNAESVITVGSTHRFQPHTYGVSYFSSRGPTGDGRIKPDLVAPGERIDAPVPNEGRRAKDGTSMAAPHVSGAAAMLLARHTELVGQPGRIKQALTETATDLGRERYFQGRGMLDVLRALQSI